ncbi:MAG TPA: aminoglycoside phosphotransferase family protein [Alphaproteobacteria bacterium]|nr:aminoglycoside phosphotransferase family protein [Alphaproteobacteria bacterium]HQS94618.1 aminoglycoside phosphotransferase family protein [Alphaproteobacteria bacterium]
MTFKQNWEKADTHHTIPADLVKGIVNFVYPSQKLISQKIISGGCANLNIKICLEGDETPRLVRLYLRDKEAAYREQALGDLLKKMIPLPEISYVGDYAGYRFAIANFMEGITLRDLLLSKEPHNVDTIMYDVGKLLGRISHCTFPKAGFFGNNLTVIPPFFSKKLLTTFVKKWLQDAPVISQLSPETRSKIEFYFDFYAPFLPDKNEKSLVHGDFDPANILVRQVKDTWTITGILDWEFAFSGSPLWDLSNMLRYAHEMPSSFETAFLRGLKKENIFLPPHWRITTYLLTLSSLLSLLARTNPKKSPIQCTDIKNLIEFYLNCLDLSKGKL